MANEGIAPHELQVGEMPQAEYFSEITPEGKSRLFIGINTYSIDGKIKQFAHFRDIPLRLDSRRSLNQAAVLVAKWKVWLGIDTAIGPGVDVRRSNPQLGYISPPIWKDNVGFYMDSGITRIGDLGNSHERIPRWAELAAKYPEAKDTLKRAMEHLPHIAR